MKLRQMKPTLEPDPLIPGLIYEQQGKLSDAIAELNTMHTG